jgi:hypothetical protein
MHQAERIFISAHVIRVILIICVCLFFAADLLQQLGGVELELEEDSNASGGGGDNDDSLRALALLALLSNSFGRN